MSTNVNSLHSTSVDFDHPYYKFPSKKIPTSTESFLLHMHKNANTLSGGNPIPERTNNRMV